MVSIKINGRRDNVVCSVDVGEVYKMQCSLVNPTVGPMHNALNYVFTLTQSDFITWWFVSYHYSHSCPIVSLLSLYSFLCLPPTVFISARHVCMCASLSDQHALLLAFSFSPRLHMSYYYLILGNVTGWR